MKSGKATVESDGERVLQWRCDFPRCSETRVLHSSPIKRLITEFDHEHQDV